MIPAEDKEIEVKDDEATEETTEEEETKKDKKLHFDLHLPKINLQLGSKDKTGK
jgi:hypothetical protein